MKKQFFLWMSLTMIYSLFLALIFVQVGIYMGNEESREAEPILAVETTPLVDMAREPDFTGYTVMAVRNHLVVYRGDDVIREIEMDITTLPKDDAERLWAGIRVETEEEVAHLIEDFTS